MIGFRGISDPETARQAEVDEVTKEAQERANLRMYERALHEQQDGDSAAAAATYEELLSQPLVAEVELSLASASKEVSSAPLLKYLCFKNLAAIKLQDKSWKEAVECYASAASIDDTDIIIWYKMGSAAFAGKHMGVARYALEKALAINSRHWLTVQLLIKVFVAQGNDVAMRELVDYAISIDPSYKHKHCTPSAPPQIPPDFEIMTTADDEAGEVTQQQLELPQDPSWLDLAQGLTKLASEGSFSGDIKCVVQAKVTPPATGPAAPEEGQLDASDGDVTAAADGATAECEAPAPAATGSDDDGMDVVTSSSAASNASAGGGGSGDGGNANGHSRPESCKDSATDVLTYSSRNDETANNEAGITDGTALTLQPAVLRALDCKPTVEPPARPTVVVSWGGIGAGKSTAAALLFAELPMAQSDCVLVGVDDLVELVPEYRAAVESGDPAQKEAAYMQYRGQGKALKAAVIAAAVARRCNLYVEWTFEGNLQDFAAASEKAEVAYEAEGYDVVLMLVSCHDLPGIQVRLDVIRKSARINCMVI